MNNQLFQNLNLEIGEQAKCTAGYPHKSTVIVECIKDFSQAPSLDHIINNSQEYVKVVKYGLIGLSTSHLISDNWSN